MAGIASKNPFDLLGDDDTDTPAPAPKSTGKAAPKAGKAPSKPNTVRGGDRRHEQVTGNEAAFRDRGAGSRQNRDRETGEPRGEGRGRGGRGRGRGRGRGDRGAPSDDRHSKTGIEEHEKQAGQAWGANTGEAELADEKAGDAIAKADANDEWGAAADAEPAKEEPKAKSFDDYLAEKALKQQAVGGVKEARKANEGVNKKLQKGVELARDEEEEDFIAGGEGKKVRHRVRNERNVLELDGEKMRQVEGSDRRGRGRGRGGDFGGRGGGGRGRGDGGFRGDRPSRGRGGGRGGHDANAPNILSQGDFPTLGKK